MFDAEFDKHHYKLLNLIDDSMELEVLQNILDDHERRNMKFFTRITNIRCRQKTVTSPSKPAEETIYIGTCTYNSRLQLITSRTRFIEESIDKTELETVDFGVLKHLLEQDNDLQTELELIFRELIPV